MLAVIAGYVYGRFLNVHNFGLSAFDVRRVVNRMRRPISLAKSDPGKFGVMIAGDWNFLVPGDSPTLLSSGSRVVDFLPGAVPTLICGKVC